jgi:hypothetical protein
MPVCAVTATLANGKVISGYPQGSGGIIRFNVMATLERAREDAANGHSIAIFEPSPGHVRFYLTSEGAARGVPYEDVPLEGTTFDWSV